MTSIIIVFVTANQVYDFDLTKYSEYVPIPYTIFLNNVERTFDKTWNANLQKILPETIAQHGCYARFEVIRCRCQLNVKYILHYLTVVCVVDCHKWAPQIVVEL